MTESPSQSQTSSSSSVMTRSSQPFLRSKPPMTQESIQSELYQHFPEMAQGHKILPLKISSRPLKDDLKLIKLKKKRVTERGNGISYKYVKEIQDDTDSKYFFVNTDVETDFGFDTLDKRYEKTRNDSLNIRGDKVTTSKKLYVGDVIEVFGKYFLYPLSFILGNIVQRKDILETWVISMGHKEIGLLQHAGSLPSSKIGFSCSPNVKLETYVLNGGIYLIYRVIKVVNVGKGVYSSFYPRNLPKMRKQLCPL